VKGTINGVRFRVRVRGQDLLSTLKPPGWKLEVCTTKTGLRVED
jgi:hypothetical protein